MEAMCNNPECSNALSGKSFEVEDISGKCPMCGQNSLIPSSASDYISPSDHKKSNEVSKSKDALKKISKEINHSPSKQKRSIEDIEMSYHNKLQKLSKSIKNEKAMKKFRKIDDDLLGSNLTMKDISMELKKIDGLFDDFEKSSVSSSKTKQKKSSSKKSKSTTKGSPKKTNAQSTNAKEKS
ncbi:MAG: hypothetical protein ACOCUR_00975 [Nanoarchaeota archaeon]